MGHLNTSILHLILHLVWFVFQKCGPLVIQLVMIRFLDRNLHRITSSKKIWQRGRVKHICAQ